MYFTYINDVESVIVLLMQCINSNKKYQKIHVCSFICVMKCLGLCMGDDVRLPRTNS